MIFSPPLCLILILCSFPLPFVLLLFFDRERNQPLGEGGKTNHMEVSGETSPLEAGTREGERQGGREGGRPARSPQRAVCIVLAGRTVFRNVYAVPVDSNRPTSIPEG